MITTTEKLPPALVPLERQAADLAGAYANLTKLVAQCEQAKAEVERQFIGDIRRMAGIVSKRREALLADVAERPSLFEEPKSVVLHGWKLGWRKQPGQVVVTNEPGTIAMLKAILKNAVGSVVRVKESLDLRALREQPATILAKAGVRLEADIDQPFVARVGGDVEKLVADLLKRAEAREQSESKRN